MVQLLVPLNLFLDRLDLLLVQAEIRVHQLDHLDGKGLACVDIEGFVNFPSGSTAELFTDLPFDDFPLYLLLFNFLWKKVVLLLDLFQVCEWVYLQLAVDHVKVFVYFLHVRCHSHLSWRSGLCGHDLNPVGRILKILNFLVLLLDWCWHSLITV